MAKIIFIKLKKAGSKANTFTIVDSFGNVLATDVTKKQLITGVSYSVEDDVFAVTLTSTGEDCPIFSKTVSIGEITRQDLVNTKFVESDTATLWRHVDNPQIYNQFYGVIHPYIIEYPFAHQYHDEIIQSVKDYTKAYKYIGDNVGRFDDNRRIQTNTDYFNKAILYNDQQSSGVLVLEPKPKNNMSAYMSYPKYNSDSKTITFTKSDNFYQYNTFWSIVKDISNPLFLTSCKSMSFDKVVNQENMDYGRRSFKKETLRGKDVKVRHILDNKHNVHLVSQFVTTQSQVSFK